MEVITEDRVKTITHEAINQRLSNFREQFCEPKYEQLKTDRAERGKQIEKIDEAVSALATCMNGKFNKLYYLLFSLLGSVIMTLASVWLKK